jgi:uncharacterized membrane protein
VGAAPEPAAPPQTPPPPVYVPAFTSIPSNLASVLCYVVPIVGPAVFLVLSPYNRDRKIRFDAWQALFLHIAFIAARIVVGILSDISWHLNYFLDHVLDLAYLLVILFMAIKVYQNEKVVLPVIGPLAEKQK